MLPQTQARKKRNSSRVNFIISFAFHAALALVVLYFAARQGWLGKQAQNLSVELVKPKPKPKPPEPEKPKEDPPKVVETPKPVETIKPVETVKAPPSVAPPVVAPPAAEIPDFYIPGGATVISGDPVDIYKNDLERAFRSKWNRPENMADDNYVAEVQVSVGRDGQIGNVAWQKGSGDSTWDDSVRAAIAAVTRMAFPPPTNFPPRVTVQFDVKEETEPVLP